MNRKVCPDDCLDAVAEVFRVDRWHILGGGMAQRLVHARWMFYVLCRDFTPLSYPEIARCSGLKSHSTIIDGVRKLRWMIHHGAVLNMGLCLRTDASAIYEQCKWRALELSGRTLTEFLSDLPTRLDVPSQALRRSA